MEVKLKVTLRWGGCIPIWRNILWLWDNAVFINFERAKVVRFSASSFPSAAEREEEGRWWKIDELRAETTTVG